MVCDDDLGRKLLDEVRIGIQIDHGVVEVEQHKRGPGHWIKTAVLSSWHYLSVLAQARGNNKRGRGLFLSLG